MARLEVARTYPAKPQRVWAAWTDAAGMRRWMCPGDVEEARVELDVRKGGSYTIDMVKGDEVYPHRGEYLEVDEPRKLVFTWISPATGGEASVVSVTLTPEGDGTRLVLVHEKLPGEDSATNHEQGWSSILEKLAGALQSPA